MGEMELQSIFSISKLCIVETSIYFPEELTRVPLGECGWDAVENSRITRHTEDADSLEKCLVTKGIV